MTESAMGDKVDLPLMTPFIEIDKYSVIRVAKDLHAPLHLTWSCMVNDENLPHNFGFGALTGVETIPSNCGKCPSCEWRLESFRLANLIDPAPYAIDTASQQRKRARQFPYYSSAEWLKEVDRSSTRIQ